MTRAFRAIHRKWRRYREFSPVTRRAFRISLLQIPAIRVGLRLQGFKAYAALLEDSVPARRGLAPPGSCADIERGFHAAVRYLPMKGSCLSRSLALCRVLRRFGQDARLHVGVDRAKSDLGAHAWVEVGARPMGKDGARREQFHLLTTATRPAALEASTS
ncbi:MAG: lasso peptide biosynthesis B2 protein [Xanthomonadales bacterium]|nr:lasso peptide biosynthesis B2 protein [Xanthomonadales bacterium]